VVLFRLDQEALTEIASVL